MTRRPTAKCIAYTAIRDAILSGRLPPGTPITEAQLSEKLSVSRTPIREALGRLAGERLVTLVPHKGAVVTGISVEDCWDIFLVREALEGLAAALCAQRMDTEQLQALSQEYRCLQSTLDDVSWHELAAFGSRLHDTIQESARSPRLSESLAGMRQQMLRLGDYQLHAERRAWESFREHGEIIDALVARAPVAAEGAMRRHVRRSAETAARLLLGSAAFEPFFDAIERSGEGNPACLAPG